MLKSFMGNFVGQIITYRRYQTLNQATATYGQPQALKAMTYVFQPVTDILLFIENFIRQLVIRPVSLYSLGCSYKSHIITTESSAMRTRLPDIQIWFKHGQRHRHTKTR